MSLDAKSMTSDHLRNYLNYILRMARDGIEVKTGFYDPFGSDHECEIDEMYGDDVLCYFNYYHYLNEFISRDPDHDQQLILNQFQIL